MNRHLVISLTASLLLPTVASGQGESPVAPSAYEEAISTPGADGGVEDEVDAGAAQAERAEAGGDVPGVDPHQIRKVEEIVVRARRRQEFLEDTPISITALSETTLRESGVLRLDDIQALVPNLLFQTDVSGMRTNIRIRGVGTSSGANVFDPGVGLYIDGVFVPRALGTLVDIVDVQQIEVLRGPQGTLFGKNTVGGAINITTVKPREGLEGFAMIRPGNFGRVDTRATLNVPIVEGLLLSRFTVASTNISGYTTNSFLGVTQNGANSFSVLGAFRLLPHDDVTIDLTGTWTRNHNNGISNQCVPVEGAPARLQPLAPEGFIEECAETTPFNSFANVSEIADLESYGVWATAEWDVGEVAFLGDISVKSLTSWREQKPRIRGDTDETSFRVAQNSTTGGSILDGSPGFQQQIMQEGQLNGVALDGALNYVAGAFGFWESADSDSSTWTLPDTINSLIRNQGTISNWTWALFGQATYEVLDWMNLTAGIRYTQDKKGMTTFRTTPRNGGVLADISESKVFDAWTPMASLAMTVPEDLLPTDTLDHAMGYFTYARGFKGGGFNNNGVQFEPETLDNFEVGFKVVGLDQTTTLNTSFFYGKYDDIQVTAVQTLPGEPGEIPMPIVSTFNAAKATTKGFEIELLSRPADGLLLTGSVGYTHATYDSFPNAVSDFDSEEIDRSGDRFLFVPRLQTFVSAQYSFALPGLEESAMEGWLTPRLEWSYQSAVQWTGPEIPAGTQRGYNLLNARLSYDFFDNQAQVALWAKNLLDEEYFNNAFPLATTFGMMLRGYMAPRTFGGELSYRF